MRGLRLWLALCKTSAILIRIPPLFAIIKKGIYSWISVECLVIYLTFNMFSLKSVRSSACLLCMRTLVLYLATQSPSSQCPLKLSWVNPTWWNLLKRNLRGAVSPDFLSLQTIQHRGQRLSLAANNSISDFDGYDACLFPQPCQLLNCAEPAGQICRDSLSSSSAFYENAAGHAGSLPRGGLEGRWLVLPFDNLSQIRRLVWLTGCRGKELGSCFQGLQRSLSTHLALKCWCLCQCSGFCAFVQR